MTDPILVTEAISALEREIEDVIASKAAFDGLRMKISSSGCTRYLGALEYLKHAVCEGPHAIRKIVDPVFSGEGLIDPNKLPELHAAVAPIVERWRSER